MRSFVKIFMFFFSYSQESGRVTGSQEFYGAPKTSSFLIENI